MSDKSWKVDYRLVLGRSEKNKNKNKTFIPSFLSTVPIKFGSCLVINFRFFELVHLVLVNWYLNQ